eukprot:10367-Pelagococcus_subviridis.AAC.1
MAPDRPRLPTDQIDLGVPIKQVDRFSSSRKSINALAVTLPSRRETWTRAPIATAPMLGLGGPFRALARAAIAAAGARATGG